MKLKYQTQIDQLSPDFTAYAEAENRPSFRWVFSEIKHPNNFLPTALANPSKPIKGFEDWSLSFFETADYAESRLLNLTRDKRNAYKKLGTHIAQGILSKQDGISELKCDVFGHFNHFEYEDCRDLSIFFVIVKEVIHI